MTRSILLVLMLVPLSAMEVAVRVVQRTYTVETAESGARGAKPGEGATKPGHYPVRGTHQRNEETVEVVELDNGLITAVVCPAWGGRLLRVTDNSTGVDYFQVREIIQDYMPWQAGGVKASFPFFEHGLPLRIPAGWRVVRGADGSATVAMDLRFTDRNSPADALRYGGFSDEILTVCVTVAPETTLVTWQQRKDNPNPLPRGDRLWNLVCFPQQWIGVETEEPTKDGGVRRKRVADQEAMRDATRMLFPATWVTDHGPTSVHTSPHWSALENWEVSHFAVEIAAPFVGAYYPQEPVPLNRLRIHQPEPRAAAKLYTAFWADMVEHWGGIGDVFEHPGILRPGHAPVAFAHAFWITQGLGEVVWADTEVAVSITDDRVQVQTPRTVAAATVTGVGGAVIAQGACGPHTVLTGHGDHRHLRIEIDGRVVLDRAFPLERPVPAKDTLVPPHIQAIFATLSAANPYRLESESFGRNEGMPGATDAAQAITTITAASDPVQALSIARAAHRLGLLDEVVRVAQWFPGPEADLLLGLVATERNQDSDFGSAGWEADWLRALRHRRLGDTTAAVKAVDRYVSQVPDAWYPRLAAAYWQDDIALARTLAASHPASPEAQLVLQLLGDADALDDLIRQRPEASRQCDRFRRMLVDGIWSPMPRYGNHP